MSEVKKEIVDAAWEIVRLLIARGLSYGEAKHALEMAKWGLDDDTKPILLEQESGPADTGR